MAQILKRIFFCFYRSKPSPSVGYIKNTVLSKMQQKSNEVNPRIALGGKKNSPQLGFWISKKFLFSVGRCPFVTFPEYKVGTKCNNQVANRCTRSYLAWRQNVWFFEIGEILWSCWLIWQNRSKISIVVIQVTKSNFPTTATSKKVFPNDSNNELQPEIAIWPPKPEILISLELWQMASKFQRQSWCFRPHLAEIKYFRFPV